jgi:hypothetical protein
MLFELFRIFSHLARISGLANFHLLFRFRRFSPHFLSLVTGEVYLYQSDIVLIIPNNKRSAVPIYKMIGMRCFA